MPAGTRQRRRAFTLTELLVVLAILLLLLGLAAPAFSFLTGRRSVESGVNTISPLLGRARAEAIGSQRVHGLMSYLDPTSGRVTWAMVRQVQGSTSPIELELVPDRDPLTLAPGVMSQTLDDTLNGLTGGPNPDRYIGFNRAGRPSPLPPGGAAAGGVILFDANGRLLSRPISFRLGEGSPLSVTPLGELLTGTTAAPANALYTPIRPGAPHPRSAIGIALFDRSAFDGQNFSIEDSQVTSNAYTGTEAGEETWIDDNALIVLVNRFNGTLIRTE